MDPSLSKIQADFDRLALLTNQDWNHNSHYHAFLLRQAPRRLKYALEIGCGAGEFSRLLAQRAEQVLAFDLSPNMIQNARERSKAYPNIEFAVADAVTFPYPADAFDCIASIAAFHHMPFKPMLQMVRNALAPSGFLLLLDLYKQKGWSELASNILSIPASFGLRLVKTGRLREPANVRAAWAEHGRSDVYLTLAQIRELSRGILPGATIRRHLLWRYSLVWQKTE